MSTVLGTYRNGTVTLHDVPAWPEASEVEISLVGGRIGCTEEEQGTDPASISAWIEWYRDLQPASIPELSADAKNWHDKAGYYSPSQLKEVEQLFQ